MGLKDRLQHAWNAFTNRDPTDNYRYTGGYSSSYRPDRPRLSRGNERSIATSVFNRISMDVAAVNMVHAKIDQNGKFVSYVSSGLNNCLTLEANKDQTGRGFIQDIVLSMLDEGCVAIVPVDTTTDPKGAGSIDIDTMRTGKIKEWYPDSVLVELYNDQKGINQEITLPKSTIGIIENPLYAVINETNSTLQRLIRKLVLLDSVDTQSSSGKLNLIMQLPYVIKTEARRKEAEKRKKDLEDQMNGSQYGIGYIDGTEKVTQLNRSIDNNLMSQIEYLTSMLYSQLGITTSVLDGTADEKTMINYYNRTVEPILSAIADELKKKFISKTARTQGQSVVFFRDPFKLLTLDNLAEVADKLIRNEVTSANEIRQGIGMQPSDDPKADQLRNPNMPQQPDGSTPPTGDQTDNQPQSADNQTDVDAERDKIFNDVLDSLTKNIDGIIANVTGGEQNG